MADDTLEIREMHTPNNGRDPFPILVSRQRFPRRLIPKTYPSVEKEIISESTGFFEAGDLIVGEKINVGGRNMLLFDCDEATRRFSQGLIKSDDITKPLFLHYKVLIRSIECFYNIKIS